MSATKEIPRPTLAKPTELSTQLKLEEFEAIGVKTWFDKDLESKNTLVLEAHMKGTSGHTKAKISLDPQTQKDALAVGEQIEVAASLHPQVNGLFKVEPRQVSAHLDFGQHAVSGNWLNPYLLFNHARVGGVCKDGATVNLGLVTNSVNNWGATVRHQGEISVALHHAADQARQITFKHNLHLQHKQFGAHLFQHIDWSGKEKHQETKLAFTAAYKGAEDYLQVDLDNNFKPKNVGLGFSYAVAKGAKVYVDLGKPVLADKAFLCPVGTELSAGASYAHAPTGLSGKIGYFHGKRVASTITYGLNKNLTAALSFDVRY